MIKTLSNIIKIQYHAEVIGIFASYIIGEEKPAGDIDVLVKFDYDATLFDLVGLGDYLSILRKNSILRLISFLLIPSERK